MASSMGIATPVEDIAKNVRRSRLSFHLNTPRRRRWLLVQLVSIPVDQAAEESSTLQTNPAQAQARQTENWSQFIENHRASQLLRPLV